MSKSLPKQFATIRSLRFVIVFTHFLTIRSLHCDLYFSAPLTGPQPDDFPSTAPDRQATTLSCRVDLGETVLAFEQIRGNCKGGEGKQEEKEEE